MSGVLDLILIAVLVGPIFVKPVEHNIELFFLTVGACVDGNRTVRLVAGARCGHRTNRADDRGLGVRRMARLTRPVFDSGVPALARKIAARWIYFTLIVVLGLLSSVITAVIAALLLVEAIAMLKLDRPSETAAVVLACFAIGLGAALTPVGEPLGTIAIAALSADFWYLMRLLGPLVCRSLIVAI